jgi:hypothetical protein
MNLNKLKSAENQFFITYPGGFEHPDLIAIAKKHNMPKMIDFTQQSFSKESFNNPEDILFNLSKTITRASMVSLFEKPKFKDFITALSLPDRERLITALYDLLHGNMKRGFESYTTLLNEYKLAKWSLVTIVPAYFRPTTDVFVKPTTAKGIIEQFDIPNLIYKAQPSWDFYKTYRDIINNAKTKVDDSLSPSNAAFSGFLMMSLS